MRRRRPILPDITERLSAWHDRLQRPPALRLAELIDLRRDLRETLETLKTLRMSPADYEREVERLQMLLVEKEAA